MGDSKLATSTIVLEVYSNTFKQVGPVVMVEISPTPLIIEKEEDGYLFLTLTVRTIAPPKDVTIDRSFSEARKQQLIREFVAGYDNEVKRAEDIRAFGSPDDFSFLTSFVSESLREKTSCVLNAGVFDRLILARLQNKSSGCSNKSSECS